MVEHRNKETFLVSISLAGRVAANVLLFYLLAIFMTPGMFGGVAYFYTTATLLSCLIEYGFSTLILSQAKGGWSDLLPIYLGVRSARLYLTLLALVLYLAVTAFVPWGAAHEWHLSWYDKISIFVSCALFTNAQTAEIAFRATGEATKELELAIKGNSCFVAATMASLWIAPDASLVPSAMLVGRFIHFVNSFVQLELVRRRYAHSLEPDTAAVVGGLSYLIQYRHFALQVVAATAYLQIDSVLLGQMGVASDVAIYQLFFRVGLGLGVISDASAATTLRRLTVGLDRYATHHIHWRELLQSKLKTALSVAVAAGLAAAALICLIAKGIIFRVGKGELEGYTLERLACLSLLIIALTFVRFWAAELGANLTARSLQRVRAKGALISLAFVVVLCVLLIPILGLIGAAISNLCGNLLLLFVYVWALQNYASKKSSDNQPAFE